MAIAAYNSSILITSQPSISLTDEATSTSDLTTYSITDQSKRYLDKSVATVVQAEYDETQTITVTGSPTGGTYTLTFGAQTTSTIAFDASAATVQAALQALSSIGAGNALVTGANGGPYTVEFAGTLAKAAQSLITLQTNSLTGGSSPSVTIARVKAGSGFTIIATGFTLFRCNARVVFAVAQPAGTVVRLHSGAYFAVATLAEASSADFSGKVDMDDVTVFNSSGVKSYLPTTLSGTLKLGTFWVSIVRSQSLVARDLIAVSFILSTGNHYDGYAYASDLDIKFNPQKAVVQGISLQLTDEFFSA